MKQETKQTIDWIKKQINLAKETCINPCHKDGYPEYEADYNKAMSFLDSLPDIEMKLCYGGYVQDANGIPCCDGDYVKITVKKDYEIPIESGSVTRYAGETLEGRLTWNKTLCRFYVITRYKDFQMTDLDYPYITKVE